jgi:UDP-glucose 4-epimerase
MTTKPHNPASSMENVLVTGGCGFVGRNVVKHLLRQNRGETIWIVDDLSAGRHPQEWLPSYRVETSLGCMTKFVSPETSPVVFAKCDVRYFIAPQALFDAITGGGFERPSTFGDVFHFAAIVGGRVKIEGDPILVAQDLAMDAEFFAWAVSAKPKRLLYPSSSAAYPIDLQTSRRAMALREDHICFEDRLGQPDMTYGWSKLTGEYLARIAAGRYGLHIACVRPFSGYGEDQDLTYPIPAVALRAANREDPLVVWGSGQQSRDFVHIDDCVKAIMLALDFISDGSAVNIGSGKPTTFVEVARTFARLAGYNPQIKPLSDMPSGVYSRFADTSLSWRLLGWKPSISLEEGFERVLKAVEARRG